MGDNSMNPMLPPNDPEDLTRTILSRTSGATCHRLQALACEYVDGELDQALASLVGAHLEHCPACSGLVIALTDMKRVLPSLAEVDPGPWFTQRVLRVTLHAPRHDLGSRLRTAWSKLLHRPRIALETAYLGAAAGMMGLYLPHPTLPSNGVVPAVVQAVSPNHVMRLLLVPARRVVGPIFQAEQRTASALRRAFLPEKPSANQVTSGLGRWQVLSFKVRGWAKRTLGSMLPAGKPAKKATKTANP